jgi:hypothetical protein
VALQACSLTRSCCRPKGALVRDRSRHSQPRAEATVRNDRDCTWAGRRAGTGQAASAGERPGT